ncbi:MAG: hypothetical protein WBQ61_15210 [Candidatus Acidiferrum sp.]
MGSAKGPKLNSRIDINIRNPYLWLVPALLLVLAAGGHWFGILPRVVHAATHLPAAKFIVGGLTQPQISGGLSPELLVNADFTKGLDGWIANPECWSIDRSASSDVTPSLKLSNPNTCVTWTPDARNQHPVPPGTYTISGEVKTLAVDGSVGGGVRVSVGWNATQPFSGTSDWIPFNLEHLVLPAGAPVEFHVESYRKAAGTAWFRHLSLRRELPPPLALFLLYPNYRALLFDDQSQLVKLDVEVANPERPSTVNLAARDSFGNVVASASQTASSPEFTMQLDLSAVPVGTYTVEGTLIGSDQRFKQSSYRVVKLPAGSRQKFKAYVDSGNRLWLDDGQPHFILGIYDTTGYSESVDAWTPELNQIARAPINTIINYWITNAPATAIRAYTEAMRPFGIRFLATVNNFYTDNPDYPNSQSCASQGPNALISCYSSALAGNSRVAGYYVQDEPLPNAIAPTFHQYQLIKANDPAGITLAVLNRPQDLPLWRDAVDVLSVDPYPMWVPPYNWSMVPDWTRAAVAAVHGSRPVWTVIQFFKATSVSSWPTDQQLFDMSWAAIAEGATGVFYWSHGAGALAWVKDPAEHNRLYTELINVTEGINALEPELLSDDTPLLASNSAQGLIITKEKSVPGRPGCVIAYNHSNSIVTATFTLKNPASGITAYTEGRALTLLQGRTTFSDTFEAFQAHVYQIQ